MHREEEAFYVDVEDRVIVLLSHLAKGGILRSTRVREHNIEFVLLPFDLPEEAIQIANVRNISYSVYSATKAAVRSFARTWTTDLKDRRIRVNAVSPGPIETPGLNNLVASSGEGDRRMKMLSNSVPLGRLGTPR